MMDTSLQAPNRHIHDRSAIDAMTAEWVEKHGEPRRFEQGACTHLDYLQRRMEGLGYTLKYCGRSFYSLVKTGDKRKTLAEAAHRLLDDLEPLLSNGGLNVPLGFGGQAFSRDLILTARLPGIYLGPDADDAAATVESLLAPARA